MSGETPEVPAGLLQHPWVEAVLRGAAPKPTPTAFHLEAVKVEIENGRNVDAILMTISDQTGIKSVFLSPDDFNSLLTNGMALLQTMASQQRLVVANGAMEKEAIKHVILHPNLRGPRQ